MPPHPDRLTLSDRLRATIADIADCSKPTIPADYPGFARELAEKAIDARRERAVILQQEVFDLLATVSELGLWHACECSRGQAVRDD